MVSDILEDSSDSSRSAADLRYAKSVTFQEPLNLLHGGELPEVTVVYETYGALDATRSNAVLVCHALSGDSHVAAHHPGDTPGWWDLVVGPGKPIDTTRFFVICSNVLGGCRGTTGPNCVDPQTGQRYASDFPSVAIEDMVEVQRRLLDHLNISCLHAVVGGSMGGQQALVWATVHPDKVRNCVLLATSARLSNQALAFDIVGRNAITQDPGFCNGRYYDHEPGPSVGLAVARMLAHVTYLSQEAMDAKFDASRLMPRDVDTVFEKRFSVGSYLAYQGDKFVERFDANSYVTLSLAMDGLDLGATVDQLASKLKKATCKWLVVSYSSDWLFPTAQSRMIVCALLASGKEVSFCEAPSQSGHDAFLLADSLSVYGELIRGFLDADNTQMAPTGSNAANSGSIDRGALSEPFGRSVLPQMISSGASVLDLGCGDGELLYRLSTQINGKSVGVDSDHRQIVSAVARGINVIHADIPDCLAQFGDQEFDFVVLSRSLQTIPDTEHLLREMVRVGKSVIVHFPNFAYRDLREMFYREGRSPKAEGLYGYEWYNTPNRRFPSILDVEELCQRHNILIARKLCFNSIERRLVAEDANLNATEAVFELSKHGL